MVTTRLPPSLRSLSAASASSAIGMARLLLRCISLFPVPAPASCSARLTSPSVCSSAVNGAASFSCASCFLNPLSVSSSGIVAKIVSRKYSEPSSRTSVRRVDANNIFCRTGAASGTYVTAAIWGSSSYRRRRMYSATFGFRCSCKLERLVAKVDEDGSVVTGTRDSFSMVTNSPKLDDDDRSVVN